MTNFLKKIKRAKDILRETGIKGLLAQSRRKVLTAIAPPLLPYLIAKINQAKQKQSDQILDDLFSVILSFGNFHFDLIRPMQVKEEVSQLVSILDREKPFSKWIVSLNAFPKTIIYQTKE